MKSNEDCQSGNTEFFPAKNGLFVGLTQKLGAEKDFKLFLIAGMLSGVSTGINATCFNNFLSDVYRLSAATRGIVEFPRELPGACIMVVLAVLAFMGDVRIAAIGMLAAALGMTGLGLFSPSFGTMIVWMMMLSLGTHIFLPLAPGIGMNLSQKQRYGVRLGQYNAYNLAATIAGYGIVWFGFKYIGLTYRGAFVTAAVFYVMAALSLLMMTPQKPKPKKIRFIFRKKYTLFYVLNIVNGARKQIFLTFAPWVLIQVFHLTPPVFAALGVAVSGVSILTRTLIGNGIDRKGERFVLSAGAALVIVLCLGYAFAADFLPAGIAVIVIAGCYVVDNSMNAVEMARSTYMRKIAIDAEDVTPTLSAGTSFDHVVAMTIPFFGGLLWAGMGYKYVFLAAAMIALINLLLCLRIHVEQQSGEK